MTSLRFALLWLWLWSLASPFWLSTSEADVSPEFRVSALSRTVYDSKVGSVHCAEWNDEFVLCPLIVNGNSLEFTNMTKVTSELMLSQMRQSSQDSVYKDRYTWIAVENKEDGYWATGNRDGLDAAGWLHPSTLQKIAGGPILAAQPTSDMFCFWSKLSTEIHKNMAVGIKQAYDQSTNKVSSKIYQWDGEQWSVWGEAQRNSQPGTQSVTPSKQSLQ